MKYLEKYVGFKKELAIAETFEEIKSIENKAAAAADFAKRDKIGKIEQDEWGLFRVEIERKKGQWLEANFPHGGDKKARSNKATLVSEGITKDESSDARLVNKEDELRDEVIKEIQKDSNSIISPREVSKRIRRKQKGLRIYKESNIAELNDFEIKYGDFKNVLENIKNIDLIITDPPYPKEYLNCFSELGIYAKSHLKENGFCIVYSGQYHLPEVINRLSEYLTYVWTFCLYHIGKKQIVNGVNIMCGWKPILIFSNGKKKLRFSAYDVILSEKREKELHKWQQSESGVEKLIEIFSLPNELIVDPFAGNGTFLKVANKLGRKAIGAEIIDPSKI